MKKKFLRILSFAMVAVFAFAAMGLAISAEEIDIPVIEEITEEELGEALPEEDVELYAEGETSQSFQVLAADGETAVSYTWDTEVYTTELEAALSVIQDGYTLKLLKDYTWNKTTEIDKEKTTITFPDKTFTLDGGYHTITDGFDRTIFTPTGGSKGAHDNNASYCLVSGTNLTVKDLTFTGTATKWQQAHTYGCINPKEGSLTLLNVTFKNCFGRYGAAIYSSSGAGVLTINGCVVDGGATGGNDGYGLITRHTGNATIKNLEVKNHSYCAIAVGKSGNGATLEISDSSIKGGTIGIDLGNATKSSVLKISDVTITNCTKYGINVVNNSIVSLDGNTTATGNTTADIYTEKADVIEICGGFEGTAGVTVATGDIHIGHLADGATGFAGTIYEGKSEAVKGVIYEKGTGTIGSYSIKTYTEDLKDGDVVFDYDVYLKKDGVKKGYATVNAAYSGRANSTDSTIYLLKDVDDTSVRTTSTHLNVSGATITINGNGHKITSTAANTQLFTVYGNANLTFKNLLYDGNNGRPLAYISGTNGGGTIKIDNCVIYAGKTTNDRGGAVYSMITDATSTSTAIIDIKDTIIASCTADNTNGAGAIRTNYNCTVNLENVNITGCSSTGLAGAIYVNRASSTLNLKGNTDITGNKKGEAENNIYMGTEAEVVVASDFSGKIGINEDGISSLTAGTGFEALNTKESVTKDGTNGESFAYYDGSKFAWTEAPTVTLATDSGKYANGEGIIRFMTTFDSVKADSVASYGTYALGTNSFDENATWDANKFREFPVKPGTGKSYIVDIIKVPAKNFSTKLNTVSFVKIKGIATPIYYNFNQTSVYENDNTTSENDLKNLGTAPYGTEE